MTRKRKLRRRIEHLEWELFQRRFAEAPTVSKVRILMGDAGELVVAVTTTGQDKVVDLPALGYQVAPVPCPAILQHIPPTPNERCTKVAGHPDDHHWGAA